MIAIICLWAVALAWLVVVACSKKLSINLLNMIPQINNVLDILWLLAGLISIIVLIAIFFPWGFIYEVVMLTLIVIWIAVKFWLREGWRGIKRMFNKKPRRVHTDEHDLFI